MRRVLALLVAGTSVAALASAAASPPEGFAVPSGFDVRAKEHAPLLGTVRNEAERRSELVHVDPATLRRRIGPSLRTGTFGPVWAYSPDGQRLAIAAHTESRRSVSASLQVVDPATLRRRLALPLGYGEVRAVAWLGPDRIGVVRFALHPERLEFLTVAPSAKRVLTRTTLRGQVHAVRRTPDALVLLLSPEGRIGAGTLVVASANGDVRSVSLERVWIGFEFSDGSSGGDYVGTQRGAGLAVDPEGGRAFVFPAGSDAAAIDLDTLAVAYHPLIEPVSLFRRLRGFLDPAATAKMVDGPWRSARWLGGGLVALTGVDHATWRDRESRTHMRSTPAGLTLVDTNAWRARTLDGGATYAQFADGLLLVTGGSYDSSTQTSTSMGLAAYDVAGTRRFHLLEGQQIFIRQVFGGRAYIGEDDKPIRVVDIRSGRVVDTRRDVPPWLLLGEASLDSES